MPGFPTVPSLEVNFVGVGGIVRYTEELEQQKKGEKGMTICGESLGGGGGVFFCFFLIFGTVGCVNSFESLFSMMSINSILA